ncbi:MAG TPA: biotin/lipoyl-binding protein [Pseudodesulfovibrio sp.]|nr:biotin/lipoyl-binding protein [Pseudodesulfovibrio sp.]
MTRPTPSCPPFFTARAEFRTLLLALCLAAIPFQAHGAGPGFASEDAATAIMPGGQRAQLVAIRQAVISSELAGKIITLRFREGERFKKGDTLASYDSALSRARLDRAVQAEAAARKRLEIAKDLRKLNSISVSDYEQARSDVALAEAETRAERVMVNRCRITAPFSGRVGETYTHEAEYVGEGTRLLSVYDDSAFEIETILPSR